MNKRDYIREVEALRTPDHLRRRITSLPGRRTARSFRWGRLLSLAACLVLAVALAVVLPVLLRGLHHGGEITPPPVATGSSDTIPNEELCTLLGDQFPDPGGGGEMYYSAAGNGCTLGVLLYTSHLPGVGGDNLILCVFDNRTREPVDPATIIYGDSGCLYVWDDLTTLQRYLLCTNMTVHEDGRQDCTAALFVFDGSKLRAVTELPETALGAENLPQGAEAMFREGTTFWEDHKGVINGAGLDLYARNPDWDAASGDEDSQWVYLCYLPLGAEDQAPLIGITYPTQTEPTVGFEWYNPPVLPLIVDGDSAGLRTWRKLTVDFTDDLLYGQDYDSGTPTPRVTDRYVVENSSDRALTVTLCYPQANNLTAYSTSLPAITLDGYQQDNTPLIGGALFPDTSDSWVGTFTTWVDYRNAMDSGDALAGAKADPVGMLAGVPVAVYDIVPSQGYEAVRDSLDDPWSATLAVDCTLSNPEAQVFVYGFNGYEPLSSDGLSRRYSFSCNDSSRALHRIIVVGGTLEMGPVTCYTDGSCAQTVPELTGQVSVKENLSLSDALLGCVEDFYYQPEGSVYYTEDTVQRVLCDLILLYVCGPALSTAVYGDPDQGVMADLYAENAAFIRVDDLISTASGMMRFLFWTYDVTIPAGGHVVLEATQHISPSCTQTRDEDGYLVSSAPYGFDFAPAFAGSPPLEAMELEVIHGDSLTVAESNFNLSFDGYGAISALDPSAERYFFSVANTK